MLFRSHKERNRFVEFRAGGSVRRHVEVVGVKVRKDVCFDAGQHVGDRNRQFAHRHHDVELRGINDFRSERRPAEGEPLGLAYKPRVGQEFDAAEVYTEAKRKNRMRSCGSRY